MLKSSTDVVVKSEVSSNSEYPLRSISLLPACVLYTDYDPLAPPARPGLQYSRFVCISDTHGATFSVPDGDVLLHSGDLTEFGSPDVFRVTAKWLHSLPHKVKVVIAGNHDWPLDVDMGAGPPPKERTAAARDLMEGESAKAANLIYLQNGSTQVQVRPDGRIWNIYGSPCTPEFGGMAFAYERGEEAEEIHSRIPMNTDILMTHGPPYEILDQVITDESVGCEALTARLNQVRPIVHVFGHIHEAHGVHVQEWPAVDQESVSANSSHVISANDRTICINAANWPMGKRVRELMDREIKPKVGGHYFQPVIVDLLDEPLE